MPDLLETELTRVLTNAGNDITPPPALAAIVERRFRTRRRRRAALAGVGLIVLVTAAIIAPRLGRDSTNTAAPNPSISAAPSASGPPEPLKLFVPTTTRGLERPEQAWPERVGLVPQRPREGGKYAVVAALGGDTVAVTWETSFEHPTKLYAYDVRSGSRTLLADLHGPAGVTEYFPQRFTANSTAVFWWAVGKSAGKQTVYVWRVPISGGTPSLLTSFPAADDGSTDLSDIVADEANLYWSGGPEIRRLAVTGGGAESVPGTAGFVLRDFPWAMTYQSQKSLLNILTGEKIPIRISGNVPFCVREFCFGIAKDQTGFVTRPEGGDRTPVPGFTYSFDQVVDGHIALAYLTEKDRTTLMLVDITGDKAAAFPGDGASPLRGGLLVWLEGDSYRVFLPQK